MERQKSRGRGGGRGRERGRRRRRERGGRERDTHLSADNIACNMFHGFGNKKFVEMTRHDKMFSWKVRSVMFL